MLLVAEQTDRMQQGLAVQVVGYKKGGGSGGGGDEDDDVLPSSADLGAMNPPVQPGYEKDDSTIAWTRQNDEIGASGAAYYQALVALRDAAAATVGRGRLSGHRVPALLASLPFDDKRSASEDALLVERLVQQMLG